MSLHLFAECHVDTTVSRLLLNSIKNVTHSSGIGEVAKSLQKSPKNNNIALIGWIDDDKRKPTYFNDFQQIKSEGNISILQRNIENEYLIMISPAMERLLLSLAERTNIDVSIYGFDVNFKEFCKQLKSPTIETNPNFQEFLQALIQAKTPEFEMIFQFLESFS